MDIKMKKCNQCNETKPLDCFSQKQGKCKPCLKQYKAEWDSTNSEHRREYNAKYEKTPKGKVVRTKARTKWDRSDKGKKAKSKYKRTDKGKMVCRLSSSKRRARIKQNGVENFSYEDLRIFWLGQNILDDRCYYCLKSLPDGPEHIDHYIPVAKGGSHTKVNLRPSCACCNLKKNDKHPLDFIKEIK
jgi:hypothetical protein